MSTADPLTPLFPLTAWAILLALVATCLVFVSNTNAATKPWQWTTAQAASAVRVQGDDIYLDDKFNAADLDSVACRGLSKAGKGRFVSFRCAAVFEGTRVTLFVKTRKAGGACWSSKGLSAISGACLAPGVRKRGSAVAAVNAMRSTVGQAFYRCTADGFGFYTCIWQEGETPRSTTVTFSPGPVVKT